MVLESILAFLHVSAILGWIVFATSQAAICRGDWLNPTVVQRLVRLDRILWIATVAVLLTGILRIYLGAKGTAFYAGNLLLYAKVGLFLVVMALQVSPSRHYRAWADRLAHDTLPSEDEVRGARRQVMIATHLVAVIPLPAAFLARGFGA